MPNFMFRLICLGSSSSSSGSGGLSGTSGSKPSFSDKIRKQIFIKIILEKIIS
jgi:hypothetical protein